MEITDRDDGPGRTELGVVRWHGDGALLCLFEVGGGLVPGQVCPLSPGYHGWVGVVVVFLFPILTF